MGKSYINPILKNPREKAKPKPRKIRTDKLHDIKVPISEPIDLVLRREARRYWGGSKTSLGTELLMYGIEHIMVYPDVTYNDSPFTIHCKVDHETFQKIGDYADEWDYQSIRRAAHRIFMEALKKKQLGGITKEKI